MKIQFTFKSGRVSEEEREYTEQKLEKLSEIVDVRIIDVDYKFRTGVVKEDAQKVVVKISLKNGDVFVVEEKGEVFTEVIDRIQDKAIRVCRKAKEREKTKKLRDRAKPGEILAELESEIDEEL